MKTYSLLPISLALWITGCAIGPDYQQPLVVTPTQFRHSDANTSTSINQEWWKAFEDPNLTKSIEEAVSNNFDLLNADANIDSMLGKFDTAKSYLYPQFNANGSVTRTSANSPLFNRPNSSPLSIYSANLSLTNYEIDLFGRVQRANEVVRAQLLATDYSKQTLLLSIISNAAASYLKLSSLDGQIALANEQIKVSHEIYNINTIKFRHGSIAQSILLQSSAELENSKALLAQLKGVKSAEEATFNLLLGRNPTSVITSDFETIKHPNVPAYLPSQVLQKRPDIAYAQENLIASNAKIGIAMAGYYPSFKLTGLLGIQSIDLSTFTSNPTKMWEIIPSISIPIFTAGRVSGEIKTAQADYNATLFNYKKSIVNALNEVDNALGQNHFLEEQLEYQRQRSKAMKTAFDQTRMRYEVGTISYSDLLLVQLQWVAAQQSYILAKQNSLISSVNMYKALGGGWDANQTIPIPTMLPAGR
jgi:multidrug efflux system outer membrane protein